MNVMLIMYSHESSNTSLIILEDVGNDRVNRFAQLVFLFEA